MAAQTSRAIIESAINAKLAGAGFWGARAMARQQGTVCDAQGLRGLKALVGGIVGAAIAGGSGASAPVPPGDLSHSMDCIADLGNHEEAAATRIWNETLHQAQIDAGFYVNAWLSLRQTWDKLNRPASTGATPLPYYDNMFTRDATSCETVLGHAACDSIERKMAGGTQ
jgi:hypothetical protein